MNEPRRFVPHLGLAEGSAPGSGWESDPSGRPDGLGHSAPWRHLPDADLAAILAEPNGYAGHDPIGLVAASISAGRGGEGGAGGRHVGIAVAAGSDSDVDRVRAPWPAGTRLAVAPSIETIRAWLGRHKRTVLTIAVLDVVAMALYALGVAH